MHALPRLLAVFLLGDRDSAIDSAETVGRAGLWGCALRIANLWRVIPQFGRRIRQLNVTLPPEVSWNLHEASIIGTAQSVASLRRCIDILRLLETEGIHALAFKGVGLMGNLYSSPSERMVTDVDLLIDGSNLRRTLEIIGSSRFANGSKTLGSYVDFLSKQSYHRLDNDFLYLTGSDCVRIDLQWSFGASPPSEMKAHKIIHRAERVNLQGFSFRVANPTDAIAITAHHALRNNFSPAATIKDLCDIMAWWDVHGKRWSLEEAIDHSRDCGLTGPLLALWSILVRYNSDSPAAVGVQNFEAITSAEELEDSCSLVESIGLQLEGRALNADLLRLMINPMWMKDYIVNKARSVSRPSVDLQFHGEIDMPPMTKRAYRLVREVLRLDAKRLSCYKAMLRSESQYANYQPRPN